MLLDTRTHEADVAQYLRTIRRTATESIPVLERVARLLMPAYPEGPVSGWRAPSGTYEAYAYDAAGVRVPLYDPQAVTYTLLGAIYRAEATHLLPVFIAPAGATSIPVWESSPQTRPGEVRAYLFEILDTLRRLAAREASA